MKRLFIVFLCLRAVCGYSQNYSVTIQGQPTATVGQTQSFSAEWRDPVHGWLVLPPSGTFSWYATGGTVNSSTDVEGSVTWTSVGSGVVYYQWRHGIMFTQITMSSLFPQRRLLYLTHLLLKLRKSVLKQLLCAMGLARPRTLLGIGRHRLRERALL